MTWSQIVNRPVALAALFCSNIAQLLNSSLKKEACPGFFIEA
jgi:hypothetical protein